VLANSMTNLALPYIAHDLSISAESSIWIVNASQIALMVSLLPVAALADIVGYRHVYRAGLALFGLASLGCALAPSLPLLTLARIIQGIGAAGVLSVNTALVRFVWPRRYLGRGIGINALVVAASSALGPTVAAGILSVASWPWLFAVNVPTGILTLIVARSLPRIEGATRRFDLWSALLNAVFFGLLITAIDGVGHGETLASAGLEFTGAAVAGVALVVRQLPQTSPLLPIDLLRIPMFALSIGTSICSFTGQMLAYVSLPFYLQDMLGRDQVETGLLMTPWPVMTGLTAPIAGRLADRYPAGLLGGIGLIAFAIGLALLALLPAEPTAFDISWRMAVCGFGFGMFQSPNNRAIISSAPQERTGGASGMLGTARLLGQTLGAALAALMFGFFDSGATRAALATAAVFAILAAAVSALRLRR